MDPGTLLDGRYQIERTLGQGGMGVVYLAHDTELGKSVAIKGLLAGWGSDLRAKELLKREVRTAQELRHRNICAIFHFAVSTSMPYVVMEFVEGETMRNFIYRQPNHRLSEPQFLEMAAKILSAVAYAHETGVVHRDLKPANVMVTPGAELRVMDFGIAANLKEVLAQTTGSPIALAPAYASPEQIQGEKPTFAMDIYSLGCMFYEMLTGLPPFCRGDVLYQQLNLRPPPMITVSADLSRIVMRCLEKNPEARFRRVVDIEQEVYFLRLKNNPALALPPPDITVRERPRRPDRPTSTFRVALIAVVATLAVILVIIWLFKGLLAELRADSSPPHGQAIFAKRLPLAELPFKPPGPTYPQS